MIVSSSAYLWLVHVGHDQFHDRLIGGLRRCRQNPQQNIDMLLTGRQPAGGSVKAPLVLALL